MALLLNTNLSYTPAILIAALPTGTAPAPRADPLRQPVALGGAGTQKAFADTLGYDEDTVTGWLRHQRRPSTEALGHLATYYAKAMPIMSREQHFRHQRWHYALADVADGLAASLGHEAVTEAIGVFLSVASLSPSSSLQRLEGDRLADKAPLAALHSAQTLPEIGMLADHAARHGASDEFVADVLAMDQMWREIMPSDEDDGLSASFRLLLEGLPRRRNR